MTDAFQELGYAVIPDLFNSTECARISTSTDQLAISSAGTRNLLDIPWCQEAAAAIRQHPSITALLPATPACIQCTLFRKDAERNWGVPFHQDLSIPVREMVDHPGCIGWAEREGVLYVQPPVEVLATLIAVRVQLDVGSSEAGPLRVLPGTHRLGRISDDTIAALQTRTPEVECIVPQGGALAMSPLLLHASSKVRGTSVRRVLHFLFGPPEIPYGLRWYAAV
jgi:ectoine hydroxylase-related dioxygenase (phytanoyl-CoA dioxygenase family)